MFCMQSKGEKVPVDGIEGYKILSNLIEGNPNSLYPKFYGNIQAVARHIFGNSYYFGNISKVIPSVLEQYETSIRDPAFYSIYKWVLQFFYRYNNYQPPYKKSDLDFPGVTVDDVEVSNLITYKEPVDYDISNALYYSTQPGSVNDLNVKVRQQRLNHKPFDYVVNVTSTRDVYSIVKVFIGPKFDEYGRLTDIETNGKHFVLIDKFFKQLKIGANVINRNSNYFTSYVSDRTPYKNLDERILQAIQDGQGFQIDGSEVSWGWPKT